MNFDDPAAQGSGWFGCEGTQGIYALIEAPFDATSSHHRRASAGPSAMRAASHQVELTLIDGRCPIAHGLVSTRLELAELNQLALEAMNQLRAGQADAARRVDDVSAPLRSRGGRRCAPARAPGRDRRRRPQHGHGAQAALRRSPGSASCTSTHTPTSAGRTRA